MLNNKYQFINRTEYTENIIRMNLGLARTRLKALPCHGIRFSTLISNKFQSGHNFKILVDHPCYWHLNLIQNSKWSNWGKICILTLTNLLKLGFNESFIDHSQIIGKSNQFKAFTFSLMACTYLTCHSTLNSLNRAT